MTRAALLLVLCSPLVALAAPPGAAAATNPMPNFSDTELVAGQIQAHEDAIALFTTQADQGTAQEFRAFAKQALPVLRSHLKALRARQTA